MIYTIIASNQWIATVHRISHTVSNNITIDLEMTKHIYIYIYICRYVYIHRESISWPPIYGQTCCPIYRWWIYIHRILFHEEIPSGKVTICMIQGQNQSSPSCRVDVDFHEGYIISYIHLHHIIWRMIHMMKTHIYVYIYIYTSDVLPYPGFLKWWYP